MKILQKITIYLVACLTFWTYVPAVSADDSEMGNWFYMVKTKSTDPARDDDFNAWYNDIDIPDVLEVPSFIRARRAKAEAPEKYKNLIPAAKEGNYVALYDIRSDDIDKSIVDLYVAARRMTARGRITDLLKVTEASYYKRLPYQFSNTQTKPADAETYFLIHKILCCKEEKDRQVVIEWYRQTFGPKLAGVNDVTKVNLLDLYRVMEVEAMVPKELPHLLVIIEMNTANPESVLDDLHQVYDQETKKFPQPNLIAKGDDTAVYRQMTDVKSQ